MKAYLALAASALTLAACMAQANAATISDTYAFTDDSNNVVASGSFSYDSSKTGTLGYGDLSAFNITTEGVSYDLAFVNSATYLIHFAFDTATRIFIPGNANGATPLLSAVNSLNCFCAGFYLSPTPVPGVGEEYSTATVFQSTSYTVTQVAPTPTPAALPLFASALGGLGFVGWRRKHATAA